jgi:hypothetical protein
LIGIVDGNFETVATVWHKEILWAMAQGIHVYGAASIGALRAAELAEFGMKGVGAIFRHFQATPLADDDEISRFCTDRQSSTTFRSPRLWSTCVLPSPGRCSLRR